MGEKLDFVPDKRILRAVATTPKLISSFSEFIDNSIDARIKDKNLEISIQIKGEKLKGRFQYTEEGDDQYDIEIFDNGRGMTLDEFKTCLKLAKEKTEKETLGKFGMGLKTSTLSIGNKFKIISKPHNGNERYVLEYDDEKFVNDSTQGWDSLEFERIPDNSKFHGTVIKIKKKDTVKIYPVRISQMKKQFGAQYHAFLENEQVTIKLQNRTISTEPLQLLKFNNKEEHPFSFTTSNGKKVAGWYGFYKKGEKRGQVKGNYGFDLYWKNRLIDAHSKYGLRQHPEWQRICGQINLDDFEVSHHKDAFVEDHVDFIEFQKYMEYLTGAGTDKTEEEKVELHEFEETVLSKKSQDTLRLEKEAFDDLREFLKNVQIAREFKQEIEKQKSPPELQPILNKLSNTEQEVIEKKYLDEIKKQIQQFDKKSFTAENKTRITAKVSAPSPEKNTGTFDKDHKLIDLTLRLNIQKKTLQFNKQQFTVETYEKYLDTPERATVTQTANRVNIIINTNHPVYTALLKAAREKELNWYKIESVVYATAELVYSLLEFSTQDEFDKIYRALFETLTGI